MHLVTDIVGNIADPDLHDEIHRLEHLGVVETVTVPVADLARRRLKARTDKGTDVAIALPRSQRLEDGAVLSATETCAIVVRVEAENWMRLRSANADAALRIGYFAGNLHWRVKFDGRDLLVALDQDESLYRERLAGLIADGLLLIVEPNELEVAS